MIKGFAAVLQREMKEQKMIVLLAFVTGILSLLAPVIPGLHGYSNGEIRGFAALTFAGLVTIGVTIMLGASVFARDLSESRTSFYFSRPLPAIAVWGGKVAAAILLIALTALLILTPALLAGGKTVAKEWPLEYGWLLPLAIAALFLLSNALSVTIRSRSGLILLDLVLAVLAVYWWWSIATGPFFAAASVTVIKILAWSSGATVLLALVSSSVAQVVAGKSDTKRARRSLSLALWAVLFLGMAGMSAYGAWLTHFPLEAVQPLGIFSSAKDWIAAAVRVSGRPSDYQPLVLIDRKTKRIVQTGVSSMSAAHAFSRDGSTSALLKFEVDIRRGNPVILENLRSRLWLANLEEDARFEPTDITLTGGVPELALSDDGSRIAISHNGNVTVYDTRSQRALGTIHMGARAFFFNGNNSLTLATSKDSGPVTSSAPERRVWTIHTWDFLNRRVVAKASFESLVVITASSDGRRFSSIRNLGGGERQVGLIDAETGRTVISLPATKSLPHGWSSLPFPLANGGGAYVSRSALYIVDDSTETRTIQLPHEECRSTRSFETTTGHLLIPCMANETSRSTVVVDMRTGRTRLLQGAALQLGGLYLSGADPRIDPPQPTVLLADDSNGDLFEFDPATNQRKTILRGSRKSSAGNRR